MTHSYTTFHRCEHPRPSNDVILRLIEHYPDGLKQKDKDGNLAIHSACENNAPNDKVILKMIDLYPDSLRRKDKDGNTPLHSFIENPSQINNREKVIGVMVKEYEGALAEKDKDGNLPIHSALAQGKKISIEGIKALLVNQETLLVKNARGNIPFHQAFNMAGKKLDDKANAILNANPSVLLMKKSEYFGRSLYFLNFAINKKNKKWIELCLEICRDSANCVGSNNETALHSMLDIQVYTDEDIKALLACTKAETLIKKDKNGDPVFFKAFTQAEDVLNNRSKLILEANPSVLLIPSRNHRNKLLLDWAITTANLKVIIGICRIYPEAALKNFDSNYMLPIHKICLNGGNFEVLKALEYSGNAVNYDGRSQVEKDLEVIQTAIRNIISGGVVQEYKIGTRSAKKYELKELLMLESRYKAELVREKQADMIANGLGNPRATFVRFNGAI